MTDPKKFFKRTTPQEFFKRQAPKEFFSKPKPEPLGMVLGEQFAYSEHEEQRLVDQNQDLRDRHTYIVGKSGYGKTTLMLNMIYQDLDFGNGLGVIAPEQEMITEGILPYIPKHRLDDVVYFNPADPNPIAFNPLDLEPGESIDLKVDENLTIFERILGMEGGERMAEIFRKAFYALTEAPNTTLLDFRRLLDRQNPQFRQQIISQLSDPDIIHFWRNVYPHFPKDAHLPIINRLGRFIQPRVIRNTLCQTENRLKLRQFMDTGKIVLFNLSDGILGERNSQLLGQLIVAKFQLAVMGRANVPEHQRQRFYLYIDEFQTFTASATTSYDKILSRARKYHLPLILAHQQTGQIPSQLLKDIFGNVSTMISFVVSSSDATRLSKEFITRAPEAFLGLQVGQVYCKLANQSFKVSTFPIIQSPNFAIAQDVVERSRRHYGATGLEYGSPSIDKKEASQKDEEIFGGEDPDDVF